MSLENSSLKKQWLASLIFVVMIIGYTIWHLLLNPQYVPLFLIVIATALGFVAIMVLLPEYRQRLIKGILAQDSRGKERDKWLPLYQKTAVIIIVMTILVYPIAVTFLPPQYLLYFPLAFLIVTLAAGSILIAALLKTARKWGYLILIILIVVAIIAILAGHFSKI
jgi:DMSO reductase anchor subunit